MPLSQNQLDDYLERNPNEADIVKVFSQLISTPNTAAYHGHLTGSSWLVNAQGNQVLLTHHKKLNLWLHLGGHMEEQDQHNLSRTAFREAQEESGIHSIAAPTQDILHLAIHCIPHRDDCHDHSTWQRSDGQLSNAHYHYDVCFVHQTTDNQTPTVSAESHDLRWFSLSEIITNPNFEANVKTAAKKWQIMRTELLLA